jgi:hypothetical protein
MGPMVQAEFGFQVDKVRAENGKEGWMAEHCNVFHESGIEWPPILPACGQEGDVVQPSGESFYFSAVGVPDRSAQQTYLFMHLFAYEGDAMEFYDSNFSLNFVLKNFVFGSDSENTHASPWKEACPTLTGSMRVVVRYRLPDGSVVVRNVAGFEAMQLIGWDLSFWKKNASGVLCKNSLQLSLAGNAFSAFAALPVLLTAFGGLGTLSGLPSSEPVADTFAVDSTHSGMSSDTQSMG